MEKSVIIAQPSLLWILMYKWILEAVSIFYKYLHVLFLTSWWPRTKQLRIASQVICWPPPVLQMRPWLGNCTTTTRMLKNLNMPVGCTYKYGNQKGGLIEPWLELWLSMMYITRRRKHNKTCNNIMEKYISRSNIGNRIWIQKILHIFHVL